MLRVLAGGGRRRLRRRPRLLRLDDAEGLAVAALLGEELLEVVLAEEAAARRRTREAGRREGDVAVRAAKAARVARRLAVEEAAGGPTLDASATAGFWVWASLTNSMPAISRQL